MQDSLESPTSHVPHIIVANHPRENQVNIKLSRLQAYVDDMTYLRQIKGAFALTTTLGRQICAVSHNLNIHRTDNQVPKYRRYHGRCASGGHAMQGLGYNVYFLLLYGTDIERCFRFRTGFPIICADNCIFVTARKEINHWPNTPELVDTWLCFLLGSKKYT